MVPDQKLHILFSHFINLLTQEILKKQLMNLLKTYDIARIGNNPNLKERTLFAA